MPARHPQVASRSGEPANQAEYSASARMSGGKEPRAPDRVPSPQGNYFDFASPPFFFSSPKRTWSSAESSALSAILPTTLRARLCFPWCPAAALAPAPEALAARPLATAPAAALPNNAPRKKGSGIIALQVVSLLSEVASKRLCRRNGKI